MTNLRQPKPNPREVIRLAILRQAEELGLPAFMTPLWREHHAKRGSK
ncbi:hypothetical protein [Nitrobacter sp.]|nr:hypothetical protein [Nitrobacter sp.]